MKKGVLALGLCGVFGLMSLCFFGCTPIIKDHVITATSSDAFNGGTVSGFGTYQTGENVTLQAHPNTENGFLAWIKDESIVSYEAEYSFIANSATEGKYIALFETNSFEFSRLLSVSYSIDSFTAPLYDVDLLDWKLTYNTISALQKNLAHFDEYYALTNDNHALTDIPHEDKVLFVNQTYTFNLTLMLQYTNIETGKNYTEPLTTKFSIDFSKILGPDAETNGNETIYQGENCTLSLLNQTQTSSLYYFTVEQTNLKKSNNWDNSGINNNQTLSLTFVYQNPLGDI